jgi:16S rRNA (guanine966-N2)-methyltransferase
MKIAAGIHKGKSLQVPKSGIKPTSDKTRQAVMNILQNDLKGSRFLDLYAGTGAMGIEALSNGAVFACFIESAGRTYSILKNNLETIIADKTLYRTIKHNVTQLTAEILDEKPFDIVFADPFYKDSTDHFEDIYKIAMEFMQSHGIFIFEHGDKSDFSGFPGFQSRREYGDTSLTIFRKVVPQ